jgi:transposase
VRAAEQDRPDIAGECRLWRAWQRFMDPARFVLLDETGTATNMGAPLRPQSVRRAPGRRRDPRPLADHHLDRGAARERHRRAAGAGWPDDRPGFRAYVEQFLAPALAPGDVVVLDNLAAHKVEGVRQAIVAAGASLLYLPPCSPDLNPIEQLFAKLKAPLRKAAARTRDELWQAIGRLLASVPPPECASYLSHCGYGAI